MAVSKYQIECKTAVHSLKRLKQLEERSVVFFTQLLMLERHCASLKPMSGEAISPLHSEVQAFLQLDRTRRLVQEARIKIRVLAKSGDRQALQRANQQVAEFRKKARWAKAVGVGYGQLHKPVAGGLPDSNRRRH